MRNFLVANALYWLHEFHIDGLRVDAVASMLYLDYSREHGEWVPNQYGGRENLEAIDFLRQMNQRRARRAPGCMTVAEESTAWPGVTRPSARAGWASPSSGTWGGCTTRSTYFSATRSTAGTTRTSSRSRMVYEYSEHFIMPLSHDEMVHMKGSLL